MRIAKSTVYLFAFILFLLGMEINGSDVGLPAAVTSKRIGLLVLTGLFLLQQRSRTPLPAAIRWMLLALCFVAFWASVSCLLSNHVSFAEGVEAVLPWALIVYSGYTLARVLIPIISCEKQRFLDAMVGMGFLVTVLTVLWLIRSGGPSVFLSPFALRHAFGDSFSCGMNRYLNGMLFCNMLPLAVLVGVVRTTLQTYALAIIGSLGFILISLLAAGRQTTGAIVLYALVLVTTRMLLAPSRRARIRDSGRRPRFRIVFGAGLLVFTLFAIFSSPGIRSTLFRTMALKTEAQYHTESQGRITVAHDAWETGLKYPFFGVGSFNESKENTVDRPTHNGYARLLANHGFPPLTALVGLLVGCLIWGILKRRQSLANVDIWLTSFSFLLVYVLWSINFNDILREHLLFFALILMVMSISGSMTSRQLRMKDVAESP